MPSPPASESLPCAAPDAVVAALAVQRVVAAVAVDAVVAVAGVDGVVAGEGDDPSPRPGVPVSVSSFVRALDHDGRVGECGAGGDEHREGGERSDRCT